MTTQDLLDMGQIFQGTEGYYTEGDLFLKNCTSLTSLPDNLKVRWNLYLKGCTSLKSLPVNLKVEGTLNLEGCTSLRSLPDDLEVGRSLYLNGCTLYPFDTTKFVIEGDYEIARAVHYIMED